MQPKLVNNTQKIWTSFFNTILINYFKLYGQKYSAKPLTGLFAYLLIL